MALSEASAPLFSKRPSLGMFLAELQRSPPLDVRCEQIRAHAQAHALEYGAGATTLELLNKAAAREKARTNSSNRRMGAGRRPSESRERLCGIDIVEAGLILELCRRVGFMSRAKLIAFMAQEAIAAEDSLEGRRPTPSDHAKRLTEREKRLKSLFEGPPEGLRIKLAERFNTLPRDPAGLRDELRAAAARVWGARRD